MESFDDGLNMEQKKRLLRRAYMMHQLQVCRLDHIAINDGKLAISEPARCSTASIVHLDETSEALFGRCLPDAGSTADPAETPTQRVVNIHQTFTFPKNGANAASSQQLPNHFGTQTSTTLLGDVGRQELDMKPRRSESSMMLSQNTSQLRSKRISSDGSFTPPPVDYALPVPSHPRHVRIGGGHAPKQLASQQRRQPVKTPRMNHSPAVQQQPRFHPPYRSHSTPPSEPQSSTGQLHSKLTAKLRSHSCAQQLDDPQSSSTSLLSTASKITLDSVLDKLYNFSWDTILTGLNELLCIAPHLSWPQHEREIIMINRKLLDCFRSPRTTLGRVAAQVCGELFRVLKYTRRPEFDEIVDVLLRKSADTNRFVQRDANIALDKMVSFVPLFHSVRALCSRGAMHKSPIVRTTVARLLICACALNGSDAIVGINANPSTRRRVLSALASMLLDRTQECRSYAERLCKMLQKHRYFAEYFYKDMESNVRYTLKAIVKKCSYR